MQNGLKKVKLDERTFKMGAVFDLPKLSELPSKFRLKTLFIKNQGLSDKCAAYASTTLSEIQEGVELNPDFLFAVAKDIEGDVESFGLQLISVAKAHTKVGTIEQKDVPSNINVESIKYRYIKDWGDELLSKAMLHRKESYLEITGKYDSFDTIKASIWKFREKKQGVLFGAVWNYNANDIYIEKPALNGNGHAMAIIGWDFKNGKEWLVVQNSFGKSCGDDGVQYWSRKAINANVDIFGSLMLVDMSREEVEWYLNKNIKATDGWIAKLFMLSMLRKIISLMKQQQVQDKKTLLDLAKTKLGFDASPNDIAPDGFACAESVSTILNEYLEGNFPIITGTWTLNEYLKESSRFSIVDTPRPGDIIMSPTGMGNGKISNGHVGIYGDDNRIYSNNPTNGLFDDRMTLEYWKDYLVKLGGYPLIVYRLNH